MNAAISLSRRCSLLLTWVSGFALVGAAILIIIDVILRKLFSLSVMIAYDVSSYVFAISAAWSFSYALLTRAHIRVDLLYNNRAPLTKSLMDIVSLAGLTVFSGILAYFAFNALQRSIAFGSTSSSAFSIPLWIPQSLWAAGIILFFLISLLLLVAASIAMARGQLRRVNELIGVPSLEGEIKDAVQDNRT